MLVYVTYLTQMSLTLSNGSQSFGKGERKTSVPVQTMRSKLSGEFGFENAKKDYTVADFGDLAVNGPMTWGGPGSISA